MAGRILVVDDEATIRELLRALLEEEGYEVTTAAGGREALDRVAFVDPALLLSDVCMPGMSGPDLCAALRGRYHRLPVVLMSASYPPEVAEEAACDGFLDKPFDIDELLRLVRRFAGVATPALVASA